jgi:hypothetical protein
MCGDLFPPHLFTCYLCKRGTSYHSQVIKSGIDKDDEGIKSRLSFHPLPASKLADLSGYLTSVLKKAGLSPDWATEYIK